VGRKNAVGGFIGGGGGGENEGHLMVTSLGGGKLNDSPSHGPLSHLTQATVSLYSFQLFHDLRRHAAQTAPKQDLNSLYYRM
jgi:hypothetical protein